MKPEKQMSKLETVSFTCLIILTITMFTYYIPKIFADLSSPSPPQDLTDLEKEKMQTLYEDQEKKVMLPYDPDKVMLFVFIAIALSFASGLFTGIAITKFKKK